MTTAERPQFQARVFAKHRRQQLIQWLIALVALGWVSAGSHAIVHWIGFPDPWAWCFPVIVDLGILYITPYQTDATLPDDKDWPIRTYATRTRRLMWWTVAVFNVFHMVQWVGAQPIDPGPWRIAAYIIGVIVGLTPVVIYGRVAGQETMVSAWRAWKLDTHDEETFGQAELRAAAERDRVELRERENQERADRIAAEQLAAAERDADRQAALEAKRIDAASTVAKAPREPKTVTSTAPRGIAAVGGPKYFAEAEVQALRDRLPGTTKTEWVTALIIEEWAAGNEITGTEASRRVGCDDKLGKQAAAQMKEAARLAPDDLTLPRPPSWQDGETAPGLRLAPAAEG